MPKPAALSDEEFDKIKHHIQDIRVAMMTTQAPNGTLRTRPMLTRKLDEDGTMWFYTRNSSDKVKHIDAHPAIALSFSNPETQISVSTEGEAAVVKDQKKVDELWADDVDEWFPEGKDDPNIVLLRITTLAGECWG